MSLLVTVDRYQIITRDFDSQPTSVTGVLLDAQDMLADELQRPLDEAERSERMYPDGNGRVYPKVTPLVTAPDGLSIDGDTFFARAPFAFPDLIIEGNWLDLTYTGGYVERSANPAAANRLPVHVERDIAWNAYRLLHPNTALVLTPGGLSSVSLGDASMSFAGKGGGVATAQAMWSPATLRLGRKGRRV